MKTLRPEIIPEEIVAQIPPQMDVICNGVSLRESHERLRARIKELEAGKPFEVTIPAVTTDKTKILNELHYVLMKTDHGIDGWDAVTTTDRAFATYDEALSYLEKIGYTYNQFGAFYANVEEKRNTMGAISYTIKEVDTEDE